jgi:hypothetical protein
MFANSSPTGENRSWDSIIEPKKPKRISANSRVANISFWADGAIVRGRTRALFSTLSFLKKIENWSNWHNPLLSDENLKPVKAFYKRKSRDC